MSTDPLEAIEAPRMSIIYLDPSETYLLSFKPTEQESAYLDREWERQGVGEKNRKQAKTDSLTYLEVGYTYAGRIVVTNEQKYVYVLLSLTCDDPDVKISPVPVSDRHIMPGKSISVPFTIDIHPARAARIAEELKIVLDGSELKRIPLTFAPFRLHGGYDIGALDLNDLEKRRKELGV